MQAKRPRSSERIKKLILFTVGRAQDDARSPDGEEGSVFYDTALTSLDLNIVNEGSRVAVVVAEGIAQVAPLVAAYVDGTVVEVNAGVNGFEGGVDRVAFLVAAYDVVAHLQGNYLLVVEYVLDDNDRATAFLVGLLVGVVLLLRSLQFRGPDAYAELLATFVALEDQRLAFRVFRFIEDNVVVTFRTAYSFHGSIVCV